MNQQTLSEGLGTTSLKYNFTVTKKRNKNEGLHRINPSHIATATGHRQKSIENSNSQTTYRPQSYTQIKYSGRAYQARAEAFIPSMPSRKPPTYKLNQGKTISPVVNKEREKQRIIVHTGNFFFFTSRVRSSDRAQYIEPQTSVTN